MASKLDSLDIAEKGAEAGADFRHIRSWIFDLDNTLYRADNGIFAQIEARMTDYVERLLKLPRDAARTVQRTFIANTAPP